MRGSVRNLALAVVWVVVFPLWIGDIVAAALRFLWPYLLQGWLTVLVGGLFIWWGLAIKRDSPFAAGSSLVILGLGLTGRRLLDRTSMRADRRDRFALRPRDWQCSSTDRCPRVSWTHSSESSRATSI